MTDTELRSILLARLYHNRSDDWTIIGMNSFSSPEMREEIRIAEQLKQYGLIEFKIMNRHLGGNAKITARGVDVIEGNATSPIAINIDKRQTINISGSSGFQIGDHNTQAITLGIEALIQSIDTSTASSTEKESAKSKVKQLLEHPLISAIVGGAVGLIK